MYNANNKPFIPRVSKFNRNDDIIEELDIKRQLTEN